jgi:Flp pilus assembly protein TadD
LKASGNIDEAIQNFEVAVQLNPQDTESYMELVELYLKKGQKDKAQKALDNLLKVDSTNKWALEMKQKIF